MLKLNYYTNKNLKGGLAMRKKPFGTEHGEINDLWRDFVKGIEKESAKLEKELKKIIDSLKIPAGN